MSTPVRASDRDLRALAAIVSEDRADLPDGEGLPPSLLADLMGQIRCDEISFERHDSRQRETEFLDVVPVPLVEDMGAAEDRQPAHWQHYWDCQPCSYPDRTGDLRSIIQISDFYSTRQWIPMGTCSPTPRISAAAPSKALSRALWRNRNGTPAPGERATAGQTLGGGRVGL